MINFLKRVKKDTNNTDLLIKVVLILAIALVVVDIVKTCHDLDREPEIIIIEKL